MNLLVQVARRRIAFRPKMIPVAWQQLLQAEIRRTKKRGEGSQPRRDSAHEKTDQESRSIRSEESHFDLQFIFRPGPAPPRNVRRPENCCVRHSIDGENI